MGIEVIFKIAGVGILTAVVNQVLKYTGKDEIATFSTLAGLIVVLLMTVNLITELFSTVKELFSLF
ncbi:MAG: stage III sporulation protein AC [Christensenellales bacterium]